MSPYTVAWIGWGVAFAAVEAKAIADGHNGVRGETLSENLRRVLGTSKGSSTVHRVLGTTGFLLFAGWFVPHILLPH